MSSTNKTTNCNLSQFVGTDKPAWLSDYNADMLGIDTAIGSVRGDVTNIVSNLSEIGTSISGLTTTVGNHSNNITSLQNALTNHNIVPTKANSSIGDLQGDFNQLYYNAIAIQFMCRVGINNFNGSQSTATGYRVPLLQIPNNIYNLPSSVIGTEGSRFAIGGFQSYDTQNRRQTNMMYAYWNGSATIFYVEMDNSRADALPIWVIGNVTSLNSGRQF